MLQHIRRRGGLLKILVVLIALPLLVYAYEFGPPVAHTGSPTFKEPSCTECHTGTANSAPGKVTIGSPASYTPGATVSIPVTIQDTSSGRRIWGFQLSARFKDGSQAGTFCPAGSPCLANNVQVQVGFGGVQYASHKLATVVAPATSFVYTVTWQVPASANGDIIFDASGNAGNGDNTSDGDHIFTTEVTSTTGGPAPKIGSGGIVNAASLVPAPNNIAAPGALISIFGTNLATSAGGSVGLPLLTSVNGTQVTIDGKVAPLLYVSPGQINAQVPFEVAASSTPVNVVVTVNNVPSTAEPLMIAPASPGVFTVSQSGSGAGVLIHSDNVTPISAAAPTKVGETIVIYCEGLGLTNPPAPTGAAANSQPTVDMPTVTIGGQNAPVVFSGAVAGFVGLYQVNVIVPSVTTGDQPVVINMPASKSRTDVTVNVQ